MKIRVSTLSGETLFFMDVFAIMTMGAYSGRHIGPPQLRAGDVLCIEAIADAGAMVRAADMREGAGALRFGELKAVPAAAPDDEGVW